MNLWLQIKVFLAMLLLGGAVGCFYDAYRVLYRWMSLQRRFPRGFLDFSDFLFWILVSGAVFGALQWSNKGELRGYVLLALAMGAWLYQQAVNRMKKLKIFFIAPQKKGFRRQM